MLGRASGWALNQLCDSLSSPNARFPPETMNCTLYARQCIETIIPCDSSVLSYSYNTIWHKSRELMALMGISKTKTKQNHVTYETLIYHPIFITYIIYHHILGEDWWFISQSDHLFRLWHATVPWPDPGRVVYDSRPNPWMLRWCCPWTMNMSGECQADALGDIVMLWYIYIYIMNYYCYYFNVRNYMFVIFLICVCINMMWWYMMCI